jgi:CHAT domain-containing protein
MAGQGYEELEINILDAPASERRGAAVSSPSPGLSSTPEGRDLVGLGAGRAGLALAEVYRVEARTSGGEASGSFRNPFTDEELAQLLMHGPRLDEDKIEKFGMRLFEALFAGEVGDLFVLVNRDAKLAKRGLRFRLRVAAPELVEFPWEILRPRGWSFAPAQSERMPMVRHVDLLEEHGSLQVPWPLKVLLVAASPKDQNGLKLDEEIVRISEALDLLKQDGKVAVKVLMHAKWRDLLEELRRGEHHIVHFMMHGDFDPSRGLGVLVLEDGAGGSSIIDAGALAGAFFSNPESATRLVLFNACRTADDSDSAPGRGVATSVARLNMPAVVAMQYPISDPAAIEFAREFYIRLAEGLGIDEAIALARFAIRMSPEAGVRGEWITPVLYLRAKESRLFETPGLHPLDYGRDADPVREVVRLLDKSGSPPGPRSGIRDLEVSLRRESPDRCAFDVAIAFGNDSIGGTMELPEQLMARIQTVAPSGWGPERDPRAPSDIGQLKRLGDELFSHLFAGKRADFFRQALAKARRAGLRMSLVSDDPGIDAAPWECLRDPSSGTFLTNNGAHQLFLRQLPFPASDPLDAVELPLRILFVSCNPVDLPPLGLEREWLWLQEGVRGQPPGRVEVERLRDPTPLQILDTLKEGRFHIFHFAGYDSLWASNGDVDEGLVLLNNDARRKYLPYDELVSLLAGLGALRLVVTNTCYTASRLAPMLVRTGIPAAIGMRFGIKDDVAVEFSTLFYKALFQQNLSVERALAETRKVLFHSCERFPGNWVYPTLVTSIPGADVFGAGQ